MVLISQDHTPFRYTDCLPGISIDVFINAAGYFILAISPYILYRLPKEGSLFACSSYMTVAVFPKSCGKVRYAYSFVRPNT